MTPLPFLSVIIPCREEARFIGACLESLLAGEYPSDRLEILVVDGASRDRTRDIAESFVTRHARLRVLQNPSGEIPAAMNIGLATARGEIVSKVDAHAVYPPNYLMESVRLIQEHGADAVGGVIVTEPRDNTLAGKAIARVLSHPVGSGNSHFRVGVTEPRWVDTIAFPTYRRTVFDRIGGYNESLVRSSDIDLHGRLRAAGGRILLSPTLSATYYSRGRLGDFFMRNLTDGFWALYPLAFGGCGIRVRHATPAALLASVLAVAALGIAWKPAWWVLAMCAALYFAAIVVATVGDAHRVGAAVASRMPAAFVVRHSAYAFGSLWGLLRALVVLASGRTDVRGKGREHKSAA